ncbi:MAG: UDP-N-acetylmuramate--L-alanine ligase, partial [Clostridia bacterium]|nr:UDP-N-acetylmuramate--L-alanine ligase [Clostridia bacterium]
VCYCHDAKNIEGADLVVYTAAISKDNPEYKAAEESGVDMAERSVFLGQLMRAYKLPCCIAGTHGKTTTTSMAGIMTHDAGLDPTVMVGGVVKELGGNLRIGSSDVFVTESCEYVESFLEFFPETAIILNVDEDHLDYFTGIDHIISAFNKFAKLVPESGCVIVNGTDENALKAVEGIKAPVITFGFDQTCNYYAKDIKFNERNFATYTVMKEDAALAEVSLSVPGTHNVLNSLSVFIYGLRLGISVEDIVKSLKRFGGSVRRFEEKGEYNGAILIDDYAHHPTEINATMASAKNFEGRKITAVFQSHTYTRTKALLNEFSESLLPADEIIVTDIYAAREKDLGEVHATDLVKLLKEKGKDAKYISDFSDIADYLKQIAAPDRLIITIGAGNVFKILDLLK